MTYQHATFKIGDVTVDAIRSENGVYALSLSSLAELCGKEHSQVIDFFSSAYFKKLHGNGFKPPTVRISQSEENSRTSSYSLVPLNYAQDFIMYRVQKGNIMAIRLVSALMNESLTIRSEWAFQPVDDYRLSQIQSETDEELKSNH